MSSTARGRVRSIASGRAASSTSKRPSSAPSEARRADDAGEEVRPCAIPNRGGGRGRGCAPPSRWWSSCRSSRRRGRASRSRAASASTAPGSTFQRSLGASSRCPARRAGDGADALRGQRLEPESGPIVRGEGSEWGRHLRSGLLASSSGRSKLLARHGETALSQRAGAHRRGGARRLPLRPAPPLFGRGHPRGASRGGRAARAVSDDARVRARPRGRSASQTVIEHFGTWNAAKRGGPYPRRFLTRDEPSSSSAVWRRAWSHPDCTRSFAARRRSLPSASSRRGDVGSLAGALREAGLVSSKARSGSNARSSRAHGLRGSSGAAEDGRLGRCPLPRRRAPSPSGRSTACSTSRGRGRRSSSSSASGCARKVSRCAPTARSRAARARPTRAQRAARGTRRPPWRVHRGDRCRLPAPIGAEAPFARDPPRARASTSRPWRSCSVSSSRRRSAASTIMSARRVEAKKTFVRVRLIHASGRETPRARKTASGSRLSIQPAAIEPLDLGQRAGVVPGEAP